ncbi:MAG: hypothetical protein ACLU4N_11670 [Butyricimonas faecihominis]
MMNTLGLYVDRGGKDLQEIQETAWGLDYKSLYRRITLYMKNLYGRYMMNNKIGMSIKEELCARILEMVFQRRFVQPILQGYMAYYGYSDSLRMLMKDVKRYSEILAFSF